ncbi:ADP-ribosylglycohydrolase family protein [Methanobacterium alcaliphilum]|uniref:ADP-ribosylglycohydrolase family protein n=1 Tax=Methanobacterium alcaliphilum TaxID=392018 RepID=UPI00200A8680|nr:ADP-ribosylglycohydrolase family protein [Methanobacterium alcaliphilum]MCK9151671.1 ADP-ribosylglycohydrolase family protein [Methanobacterium alcaliphilum]
MVIPSLTNIKVVLENHSYFESDDDFSSENPVKVPHYYPETVAQFINSLYEENFIQPSDWSDFSPSGIKLSSETLNDFVLSDIIQILTGHIQADRFCSGGISNFIERGNFLPIFKRLKEICFEIEDGYYGAMLGLAVGDALGAPVEFKDPGTFKRVENFQSGGPHNLNKGEWTDDTSMALALAESLSKCQGFNPQDQMYRYCRWYDKGCLSIKGYCFDIGNTTREALETYKTTQNPYSGPFHEMSAGNGSLMRMAPIPLFYFSSAEDALRYADLSSRTTHQHPLVLETCQYFTGLILGALMGVDKEELLSPSYCPIPSYWEEHPMRVELKEVADGSFKEKNPPEIRGSGYVINSLEAALWAFYNSDNFKDGCLLAVNLGEDADTTGAIYGQLAGAHYGKSGIPDKWLNNLAAKELITTTVSILIDSIPY